MLRHEFQPGRLVAGVFLALAGVICAGDAGGLWRIPWFAPLAVVVGGLCLAGATAALTRNGRRRAARAGTGAPPSR
ncbi:hypothetical protein SUDANB58_03543 [Streptomyces sp. enrichment culture]|uniref:hypothetical protein n=1 Tax=Streptomyces sp. enrichment culture TaxID=1795815 RepID=UPI003F54CCBE